MQVEFPFHLVTGQQPSATSFAVDDVVSADRPIWTQPLGESLGWRFQRKLLLLSEWHKPVTNLVVDSALQSEEPLRRELEPDELKPVSRQHPLIEAVHVAFSQHRPLTLSPDCIWSVIAQGFSHHIAENHEFLRGRLVRHQGRAELTSKIEDLSIGSFAKAIADFSAQIREASDPVLHETLICDFSTTTPDIRTASEVVLMDSYSSYFAYMMLCICGIPKITITGSVNDWERIRARVEILDTYDLGWWVSRLRPILDEFIDTAKGRPRGEFWKAIYKPKQAYGKETVTGWIADLFPYLGDAPKRRRNDIFKYDRTNWALPVDKGVKALGPSEPGAEKGASGFPSGLSSVPVLLIFRDGSVAAVDLVAGFLGVEQSPRDLALSPLIGWCVTERAPAHPVWVI